MAVYVDDYGERYGHMIMCHMIADTHEELLAMADRIGVARRWLQDEGTAREHFDVCRTKRAAAIRAGAVRIDVKALVKRMRAKSPSFDADGRHRKGAGP